MSKEYHEVKVIIKEIAYSTQIQNYTNVMFLPSLVVNEELVCVQRFPKKNQVITWLQEGLTG
jgi:hypothetical protein